MANNKVSWFIGLAAAAAASLALAAPPKAGMHIGVVIPESWPDRARGEDIRDGMLLALKTWPGQAAPTLVIKDSACDAKKAAAAVQGFIDAKVDMVVGGFCVLGTVPRSLLAAGVPFVSANAERLTMPPDAALQFGIVPVNHADGIASKLRAETGLRVTASTACWMDFEDHPSDRYDAALCPTLRVDTARWNEIAPTYTAAYRKPFSTSAARGYAAMQVALAAIKQMRAGSKPATAFKDMKEVATVLGTVRYNDTSVPEDAMQLVLAAKLPKLSAREAAAFDELMKAKGCGCKGGACAQNASWSAAPFVVRGASCGAGVLPVKMASR
jgi:ABC-type branched-subunit amino acid transport system substrate-binding protein